MKIFTLIFALLFTSFCLAIFSNGDSQFLRTKNLLVNPGFEYGISYWSAKNGGSLQLDPPNAGFGAASGNFIAGAANQIVGSSLVTVPAGLYGGSCLTSLVYKGGDSNLVLAVESGTGASLATKALTSASNFTRTHLGFNCPTSGSFRPVIYSTASAARIYLDDVYLGEDTGSSVTQEVNWYVDAYISGATVDLGTSDQAAYVPMSNSGLTLTNGSGALTSKIPCSSTNLPTGTTCSVGDESVGVSFTLPEAGPVMACAYFTHDAAIGSGSQNGFFTTFQIVETPSNSDTTITTEGGTRTASGIRATPATTGPFSYFPHANCSIFNFAAAGTKTLRLMYEQAAVVGAITASTVGALGSDTGQRTIRWTVTPIR